MSPLEARIQHAVVLLLEMLRKAAPERRLWALRQVEAAVCLRCGEMAHPCACERAAAGQQEALARREATKWRGT